MNDAFTMHYRRAEQQLGYGDSAGAVESLRECLSLDPDSSDAHALLAVALSNVNRQHAAGFEADEALRLAPEHVLAHYARSIVHLRRRELKQAEHHAARCLELAPQHAVFHSHMALVKETLRRDDEAKALYEKAVELDPADPDILCGLASWEYRHGDRNRAELLVETALKQVPEHADSLVLKGRLLLQKDAVADARDHAIWVLSNNADDEDALHLLAGCKMRTSPLTGLWWRYNTWMTRRGMRSAALVLLAAYVVYRLLTQALSDMDLSAAAGAVDVAWLAIVLYTWFGSAVFRRMVAKEMAGVRLAKSF